MIIYVVIGANGTVRGFAYTVQKWAEDGAREADETWPDAAPHRVQKYAPIVAPNLVAPLPSSDDE